MDTRPIGVFDSGLGGLTAVRKLRELLPNEDIVYFGDTARVPYGSKGHNTIVHYAAQDIGFLLSKHVKLVVAACGTVSSHLPEEAAANLEVPYVGVIRPAVQAAVRATKNGRIGVFGTYATIRSGSYEAALKQLCPTAEVFGTACPMFVPLVENGCIDHPAARIFAEEYAAQLLPHDIDTLILGCTHYPLLKEVIADVTGHALTLIDPGEQTALYVAERLKNESACSDDTPGRTMFYLSDLTDSFAPTAGLFLGESVIGQIEQVAIEQCPPAELIGL